MHVSAVYSTRRLKRKLKRLLDRLESETLTEADRSALKALLRGQALLGEAVRNGHMEEAEILLGEIFNQTFPSRRDSPPHD